jgi:hypothetical protein
MKKASQWIMISLKTFFGFIKKNSYVAVTVTQLLKKAVAGQWDNRIASLIPGGWAPLIVEALERIIPLVAESVLKAHNAFQEDKQSDVVGQLIEMIKLKPEAEQAQFWKEFAARINYYLTDGEMSFEEAWIEAQNVYSKLFKK